MNLLEKFASVLAQSLVRATGRRNKLDVSKIFVATAIAQLL